MAAATLCQLCQSIPFHDLPPFPDDSYNWTLSGDPDFHQLVHKEQKEAIPDPFGFHHHADLESLRSASASGCELCRQIEIYADGVLADIAKRDAEYAQFPEVRMTPGDPSFDLWITKRGEGSGDGFWVSTKSVSEPGKVLFPIATFGFCAEDDNSPLSSTFPGQPINGPPDSNTLDRIVNWVTACNSHKYCTGHDSSMPTRLVDVGVSDAEPTVKVVEVEEGAKGRYISLSYCWGTTSNLFTTSRSLLPARKAGMNLSDLPRTFQDAIAMTRRLGVRYIWIDSLCICQDDKQDWERESARMDSVYSNSYLTIAATGKPNTSGGLFFDRPGRTYLRTAIEPTSSSDSTNTNAVQGDVLIFPLQKSKEVIRSYRVEMKSEPLAERGWAFQERVLARRVLHFASDQTCFECLEGTVYEEGLQLPDRYYSVCHVKSQEEAVKPDQDGAGGPSSSSRGSHFTGTPFQKWNALLRQYGQLKLTFPSDKLPALSGVAKVYSKLLDDEYVAGLWRKSMIEGLCWQSLDCTAVDEYRAPSWSWASVDGIPGTGFIWDSRELGTVLDYRVEIDGDNPFGRVKNAWIKIEAPLVPLLLSEKKSPMGHLHMRTEGGDEAGTYCGFDTIDRNYSVSADTVRQMKLFALVLAVTIRPSGSKDAWIYRSLVVTPTEDVRGNISTLRPMKRVGWMLQAPEDFGLGEIDASRATVTLV